MAAKFRIEETEQNLATQKQTSCNKTTCLIGFDRLSHHCHQFFPCEIVVIVLFFSLLSF